jgi:hypothetical protein
MDKIMMMMSIFPSSSFSPFHPPPPKVKFFIKPSFSPAKKKVKNGEKVHNTHFFPLNQIHQNPQTNPHNQFISISIPSLAISPFSLKFFYPVFTVFSFGCCCGGGGANWPQTPIGCCCCWGGAAKWGGGGGFVGCSMIGIGGGYKWIWYWPNPSAAEEGMAIEWGSKLAGRYGDDWE